MKDKMMFEWMLRWRPITMSVYHYLSLFLLELALQSNKHAPSDQSDKALISPPEAGCVPKARRIGLGNQIRVLHPSSKLPSLQLAQNTLAWRAECVVVPPIPQRPRHMSSALIGPIHVTRVSPCQRVVDRETQASSCEEAKERDTPLMTVVFRSRV